jgi:hypothetical protein
LTAIPVRLLVFDGCPNAQPTHALVENVAADEGLDVVVERIEVQDPEEAARLRFLGSPTVQVNGLDIEPRRRDEEAFAITCRVYITGEGPQGLPPRELVSRALREASEAK